MWNLKEDRAFEINNYLGNFTILEDVRVRILKGIGCTKCIICIISLVIK